MVAYNWETYVWRPQAVPATPPNRAAALAWMQSLPLIEANVVTNAGLATINLCDSCSRDDKRMIFIGNITPSDSTTAGPTITGANYRRTLIDLDSGYSFPSC